VSHPSDSVTSRSATPLSETQLLRTLHELHDGVLFLDPSWGVRYAHRTADRVTAAHGDTSERPTRWHTPRAPDRQRPTIDTRESLGRESASRSPE